MRFDPKKRFDRQLGFSLIEMLTAMFIISIVMAIAVRGMRDAQQRSTAESSKVDTVQETRDFIDQVVRDVHDVGYPSTKVLNKPLASCVGNASIACGIIYFSSTQVQYEGDLDGSGTVSQVWLLIQPPQGSTTCPCVLQRGVITKAAAIGGSTPTYFTEVNGILNSGNGAGAATYAINLYGPTNYAAYGTADVFDAYQTDGAQFVGPCTDPVSCSSIRSLQITANVAPAFSDATTKVFPVVSVTSKSRMNNNSFF